MIVDTKPFFQLVRTHHKLPIEHRFADLAGRLTTMADPDQAGRFRVTPLTQRCLGLFLQRRLQPSSTKHDVA